MGTLYPADSLSNALFGKTRKAVLAVLYGRSEETFYLRQIARLAGAGMGAVQREIKSLTEAGIIRRIEKGKQVYYQANPQSPIFPELKGLIVKTAGMGDLLKQALVPLAERIVAAFVYGSFARGKENAGSDVDVFVLGDISFAEVVGILGPLQESLNREINPTVYPVGEFCEKLRKGHHFLESVLEGEKMFLIGDDHALAKLAP